MTEPTHTTTSRLSSEDSQILALLKAYTGADKKDLNHAAIATLAAAYFDTLGGHYPASYVVQLEHLELPTVKYPPQDRA